MDQGWSVFRRIGAFLSTLQSAAAASEAVRNGWKPTQRDLVRLGIDSAAFERIGRG
jgi:hypothetical protein